MFKKIFKWLENKRAKEVSDFESLVDDLTKTETCLLCGKKISSACNSHVVPQFILKGIAENGTLSYGYSLHSVKVPGLKEKTGVRNSHTFRLICDKCDKKYFNHYENPNNLLVFDSLSKNEQKTILCEMAIKCHLSHLNSKYRNYVRSFLRTNGDITEAESRGLIDPARSDMIEHWQSIRKLKSLLKSNKNPFDVIYNKLLNYPTKIATQTVIFYYYDLDGNSIFDPDCCDNSTFGRYFYLMILPYKNKTRVMLYYQKNSYEKIKNIVNQFINLSDEEKLHFIFISLIVHDQDFYMSPSFSQLIFKNDKKLVRLYSCTEVDTNNLALIKDFREYTNYLLKEYNVH